MVLKVFYYTFAAIFYDGKLMDSEVKDKIIERASSLFTENGIKGITMDDLAQYMGMSKRTIYEYFRDKEELIDECVLYLEQLHEQRMKHISDQSENMFELLMRIYQESLMNMQKINKKFIDDIKKYFPEIRERHDRKKEENIRESVLFFQEGINEGWIKSELNPEILSLIISEEMELLFNGNFSLSSKFSFFDVYKTLFFIFLRGIATNKGMKIIDNFVQKEVNK